MINSQLIILIQLMLKLLQYGECSHATSQALIKGIYEYATPSISYECISSVEEEQIYDTPCEDEDHYGPIYTEPPTEMNEIYETFKGKIIHFENIRYFKLSTAKLNNIHL